MIKYKINFNTHERSGEGDIQISRTEYKAFYEPKMLSPIDVGFCFAGKEKLYDHWKDSLREEKVPEFEIDRLQYEFTEYYSIEEDDD